MTNAFKSLFVIIQRSNAKLHFIEFKTLSILLMRGNSEILLNRSPRTLFPPPHPDDYKMYIQDV